jgi:uncharacterized protein YpbB
MQIKEVLLILSICQVQIINFKQDMRQCSNKNMKNNTNHLSNFPQIRLLFVVHQELESVSPNPPAAV